MPSEPPMLFGPSVHGQLATWSCFSSLCRPSSSAAALGGGPIIPAGSTVPGDRTHCTSRVKASPGSGGGPPSSPASLLAKIKELFLAAMVVLGG